MALAKQASFSLKNFKVPKFSCNQGNVKTTGLNLNFDPSGTFNSADSTFELSLNVSGIADDNKEIINVTGVGVFAFADNLDFKEIPEYFYANSIAIIFPYIRAFVSTMTLQANIGLIMMDTLNLSSLKDELLKKSVSN